MIACAASATCMRSLANAEEDYSSFCTLHDQVSKVSLAAELLGCGEKEICLMQAMLYCRVFITWGKVPACLRLWPGCYLSYKGGTAAQGCKPPCALQLWMTLVGPSRNVSCQQAALLFCPGNLQKSWLGPASPCEPACCKFPLQGEMIPWPQVPREEGTESWLLDFTSDPKILCLLVRSETSPVDCGDLFLPSSPG